MPFSVVFKKSLPQGLWYFLIWILTFWLGHASFLIHAELTFLWGTTTDPLSCFPTWIFPSSSTPHRRVSSPHWRACKPWSHTKVTHGAASESPFYLLVHVSVPTPNATVLMTRASQVLMIRKTVTLLPSSFAEGPGYLYLWSFAFNVILKIILLYFVKNSLLTYILISEELPSFWY